MRRPGSSMALCTIVAFFVPSTSTIVVEEQYQDAMTDARARALCTGITYGLLQRQWPNLLFASIEGGQLTCETLHVKCSSWACGPLVAARSIRAGEQCCYGLLEVYLVLVSGTVKMTVRCRSTGCPRPWIRLKMCLWRLAAKQLRRGCRPSYRHSR